MSTETTWALTVMDNVEFLMPSRQFKCCYNALQAASMAGAAAHTVTAGCCHYLRSSQLALAASGNCHDNC
jgi:hypothetical protein